MKAVRVEIRGRVQGVGFRWSARSKALDLGLAGWVRNTDSGTVEARFIGKERAVDQMLDWCRQGPPAASVTGLDVADDEPADCEASGFDIR